MYHCRGYRQNPTMSVWYFVTPCPRSSYNNDKSPAGSMWSMVLFVCCLFIGLLLHSISSQHIPIYHLWWQDIGCQIWVKYMIYVCRRHDSEWWHIILYWTALWVQRAVILKIRSPNRRFHYVNKWACMPTELYIFIYLCTEEGAASNISRCVYLQKYIHVCVSTCAPKYRWVGVGLRYLQCVSNGGAAVLH